VHWVVYDIPATTKELSAGQRHAPHGARDGRNDWKKPGYGGPCPPIGRHRYFFKLYALDAELGVIAEPTKAAVERAMQGHVLEQTELVGTYERSGSR
jgi:Raf kinase inhibitor-like YbhB/YbcL family protein